MGLKMGENKRDGHLRPENYKDSDVIDISFKEKMWRRDAFEYGVLFFFLVFPL